MHSSNPTYQSKTGQVTINAVHVSSALDACKLAKSHFQLLRVVETRIGLLSSIGGISVSAKHSSVFLNTGFYNPRNTDARSFTPR